MRATLLNDNIDTGYLDRLLLANGLVQCVDADVLLAVPEEHLKLWCHRNAVYVLPTYQLIDWLRAEIGVRSAIEICTGKSCLGRHLGIRMCDNAMQTWPEVVAHYKLLGQQTIDPPPDVERLDANVAIVQYKPQVVIGAFVTQVHRAGDDWGNAYGPDEEKFLPQVETYIHIGNAAAHADKRILNVIHTEHRFPWLISRAIEPEQNCIWVWNR